MQNQPSATKPESNNLPERDQTNTNNSCENKPTPNNTTEVYDPRLWFLHVYTKPPTTRNEFVYNHRENNISDFATTHCSSDARNSIELFSYFGESYQCPDVREYLLNTCAAMFDTNLPGSLPGIPRMYLVRTNTSQTQHSLLLEFLITTQAQHDSFMNYMHYQDQHYMDAISYWQDQYNCKKNNKPSSFIRKYTQSRSSWFDKSVTPVITPAVNPLPTPEPDQKHTQELKPESTPEPQGILSYLLNQLTTLTESVYRLGQQILGYDTTTQPEHSTTNKPESYLSVFSRWFGITSTLKQDIDLSSDTNNPVSKDELLVTTEDDGISNQSSNPPAQSICARMWTAFTKPWFSSS